MTATIAASRQAVLRRRIRLLVAATITYNLVEAVVALVAGTVASSVAPIAFGAPLPSIRVWHRGA